MFPHDMFDSTVLSPPPSGASSALGTPGRYHPPVPPLSMGLHTMPNLTSPQGSPTTAEFPDSGSLHHLGQHHPHQLSHQNPSFGHPGMAGPGNITLSRHNSFQHIPNYMGGPGVASSPSPSASGNMEMFDDSMSGHDGARV
jgi:hypothetical protein